MIFKVIDINCSLNVLSSRNHTYIVIQVKSQYSHPSSGMEYQVLESGLIYHLILSVILTKLNCHFVKKTIVVYFRRKQFVKRLILFQKYMIKIISTGNLHNISINHIKILFFTHFVNSVKRLSQILPIGIITFVILFEYSNLLIK